jgi:hypothetical protein
MGKTPNIFLLKIMIHESMFFGALNLCFDKFDILEFLSCGFLCLLELLLRLYVHDIDVLFLRGLGLLRG